MIAVKDSTRQPSLDRAEGSVVYTVSAVWLLRASPVSAEDIMR